MNGWATVTNNAGTTFKDASLKLVAGDKALFECHMYDLPRRTTLKNNEQKQISLLEAADVDVEKEYVYDDIRGWWWYERGWSETGENKVKVMLNFVNSEGNNLGIPLPKGTVRVFKEDSEGKLQFIGEDSIDHTPKDEDIVVTVVERTSGDWEITKENYNHTKVSNNEIEWRVPVKANSESTLTYTIRYKRW